MFALRTLLVLALPLVVVTDELPRSGLSDRDLAKFQKDVSAYFTALDPWVDDRAKQQKSLAAIKAAIAKSAKQKKIDEPLKFIGDWEVMLELAKEDVREIRSEYGKGFFRHQYVVEDDPDTDNDDFTVSCMVSVPKSYPKSDGFMPSIVALKPVLGLSGADLEAKVAEMAAAIYADEMDSHIILIPLGPMSGSGRTAASTEVEGPWPADDGLVAMFTAFRVLLEQLRFDRSRVTLDGWGDAGLDAVRIATSYPSWFAGVVNRGGAIGGSDVLYENIASDSVLYLDATSDGRGADLDALRSRADGVTIVEDDAAFDAPSENARKAVHDWLGKRQSDLAPEEISFRLGDIRFQSVSWIKATDPRIRVGVKPADRDFPQILAKIDRVSNRISIETVNVLSLFVFLSDALVDLDKPVVIEVNGEERVNQMFQRDLRYMLENRFYNNDGYYGLYTAEVLISEIQPNIPEKDS